MEPTPQGCWMDFAAKKERSWVKCGTKGKDNTPSPKVLCQFSIVQPCSSQKMDPLQDWSASTAGCGSQCMAHVMTNLGGTGMQIRCLVQTKSLDFFCLTGWYSKSHPLGLIPALTLEHPDHTRWRFSPLDAHQWFMYKGTTNIALQGRTNGFHTYTYLVIQVSQYALQHRW